MTNRSVNRLGDLLSTSSTDGAGVATAISPGALYKNVNVPVIGGWSIAINVYATVYRPEVVKVFIPTIKTGP